MRQAALANAGSSEPETGRPHGGHRFQNLHPQHAPCGCRKLCRGWSDGISVLVDESVTAGRFDDVEVPIWLVCSVGASKLRSGVGELGADDLAAQHIDWWRNTMISRSFERPDRTVSRASDARNRYKIRYTRTQHRPASRQVNDHGRVSGTHTVEHRAAEYDLGAGRL